MYGCFFVLCRGNCSVFSFDLVILVEIIILATTLQTVYVPWIET
jgi:hypothetical protein